MLFCKGGLKVSKLPLLKLAMFNPFDLDEFSILFQFDPVSPIDLKKFSMLLNHYFLLFDDCILILDADQKSLDWIGVALH